MTAAPALPPVSQLRAVDASLATALDIAAVIQRLFELGMDVAALCSRVGDPEVAERLQCALDDVDRAVRELRAASFAARHVD